MESSKKIVWYNLAFMTSSTVWGFGNVLNGFVCFNGIQVIFSWILMFALYFVPYVLMVGEPRSASKNSDGGVSSWINETTGPKFTYYAGWTYWTCHITYVASKGSGELRALSWAVFRNAETYDTFPAVYIQLGTLTVFLFSCWVASRGLNPLKKLAAIAGGSMLIVSILYILMMSAASVINPNGGFVTPGFSWDNIFPQFNLQYFTSLSILVFAVSGCGKISPYVNKVENPSKGFPRGMATLTIMVVVCTILGTIAMGMMFDSATINGTQESFNSYVSNGSYQAFQKLDGYYHMGDALLAIYALYNTVDQFSTLILNIDAPLRMLLDNKEARGFTPSGLLKKSKYDAYVNGIWMVVILSGNIIPIQSLVPGVANVFAQLSKLNSVTVPMWYLRAFAAYIALRTAQDKFQPEYRFARNQRVTMTFDIWCLIPIAACCVMGMYTPRDVFTTALSVITPVVLTVLGMILPVIKRNEKA